jgi:hypothetical protein
MYFEKRLVFPGLRFLCNLGSAVAYRTVGDWRPATYSAASSICIASVSF